MNATDKIQWHAPHSVTEQQRSEIRSLLFSLWSLTTKVFWPLWLLSFAAFWIWGRQAFLPEEQEAFTKFVRWFLLLGLFFPTFFAFLMCSLFIPKLVSKKNDKYELNEKGLFCHSISVNNGVGVSWKRVDQFRFVDHPDLPGVRVFEFTVKPIKFLTDETRESWTKFYFDPANIDELKLQEYIVQKHEAANLSH